MVAHTLFSLSTASPEQAVAFIGFSLFTIGFFVWVAWLSRKK